MAKCFDYPYCTCACNDCITAELENLPDEWHCAQHKDGCHKECY